MTVVVVVVATSSQQALRLAHQTFFNKNNLETNERFSFLSTDLMHAKPPKTLVLVVTNANAGWKKEPFRNDQFDTTDTLVGGAFFSSPSTTSC